MPLLLDPLPSPKDAPFIAIDFETSGLDPLTQDAVAFGFALASPKLDEVHVGGWKIQLERVQSASPEALVIAGYEPHLWADAWSQAESGAQLVALLRGRNLIAHHLGFDKRFAAYQISLAGGRPQWGLRSVCTMETSRALIKAGKLKSEGASLVAVCRALNLPFARDGAKHDAADDARAALDVARTLATRGLLRL